VRAIRRSWIVVVLQSNRNCNHDISEQRRYCVAWRPSVTLCVCRLHSLDGEGNVLYPVLSSLYDLLL